MRKLHSASYKAGLQLGGIDMNKQEVEYLRKQLQNEKEFYERTLALLDEIHITGLNGRARLVVETVQENLRIVKRKLGEE